MKKQLNEIQSYKSLYKFINCNILNNKSEIEYFIESYQKAKNKSYIKIYKNNSSYNNEKDSLNNNELYRSSNPYFTRRGTRGTRGGIRGGIREERCPICGLYH